MPYPTKSLKWDPETGDIAIRTQLPEEGSFASMAWLVSSPSRGGRTESTAALASWVDVPIAMLTALVEES